MVIRNDYYNTPCNGKCYEHYKDSFYIKNGRAMLSIDGLFFSLGFLGFKRCYTCCFFCITNDRRCRCCRKLLGGKLVSERFAEQTVIDKRDYFRIDIRNIHSLAREYYDYINDLKEEEGKEEEIKPPSIQIIRKKIKMKGYMIPKDRKCCQCGSHKTNMIKSTGLYQWNRVSKRPEDKNNYLCTKCNNKRHRDIKKQKEIEEQGQQQLKMHQPMLLNYK